MTLLLGTSCGKKHHRCAHYFVGYDTTNWYVSVYGNDTNNGHYPDSSLRTYNEVWKRGDKRGDSIFYHSEAFEYYIGYTRGNDYKMTHLMK